MVPVTIGGEHGHFASFPGREDEPEVKLEEYALQPLLGGHVVLAIPRDTGGDRQQVACLILTRRVWPQRSAEQIARGYFSGNVWSDEATIEVSLKELSKEDRSSRTHQLDLAVVSSTDDDPVRVISGRRTTVQKLVSLNVAGA